MAHWTLARPLWRVKRADRPRREVVDHVQVERAVVVQVAELHRPAPPRGIHAAGAALVDEHRRVAPAKLQRVGHELNAVVGLHRAVPLQRRGPHRVLLVRLHVDADDLEAAVVVGIALREAHGVGGGALERRGVDPALRLVEKRLVRGGEVIADQDVAPPTAIQVGQQYRQRLGMGHQEVRLQRPPFVGEQEHPAARRRTESARHQFGVVGRPHHVQVGVIVQVGPG